MAKKEKNQGLLIICLLLNIFVLAGLGSVIARTKGGVIQLILSIVAILMVISIIGVFIGAPLYLAMWIWSIVEISKMFGE